MRWLVLLEYESSVAVVGWARYDCGVDLGGKDRTLTSLSSCILSLLQWAHSTYIVFSPVMHPSQTHPIREGAYLSLVMHPPCQRRPLSRSSRPQPHDWPCPRRRPLWSWRLCRSSPLGAPLKYPRHLYKLSHMSPMMRRWCAPPGPTPQSGEGTIIRCWRMGRWHC